MGYFNVKEYTSSVSDNGNGVLAWGGDISVYHKRFQDTSFFGFEAVRAEFKDCTFDNCDFRCIDINHANFEGCEFTTSRFEHCNLSYSTFENCTFHSISAITFCDCDMEAARFVACHLDGVSFARSQAEDLAVDEDSHADLLQFVHCDLERASISPRCTDGVCFSRCNLCSATIKPVRVGGIPVRILADHCTIHGAEFPSGHDARHGTILTEELIGYKKCRNDRIVTLRIPEGAVVFQPNMGKCRTNIAEAVEISDSDGNTYSCAYSKWDMRFEYKVGDVKRIDNFSLDPSVECAPGIHFFKTREEAEDYEQ